MTSNTFTEFLTALRDEADTRLGGSFAKGLADSKPGFLSDIDLVVRPGERDDFGDRVGTDPIERAILVFERFNVPWTSFLIGQISSPRDTATLPRPVEVMETIWINATPGIPTRVEVHGVQFTTHHEESWGE